MKKLLLLLFVSIIFTSCKQPIDNYKGGVIYEKNMEIVKIKLLNEDSIYYFKTIYLLKLDLDRYNVGDTIK